VDFNVYFFDSILRHFLRLENFVPGLVFFPVKATQHLLPKIARVRNFVLQAAFGV